jgi:beta-glucosidase
MGDTLKISMKITNTGNRSGLETVQLYVNEQHPTVARPLRELKGFEKVEFRKGESKIVNFYLSKSDFSYYDVVKNIWKANSGIYKIEVGSSSHDIKLSETFEYKN